jgi:hypothetical protein
MASANFRNLPRALAKADVDFDTMTCKVLLVSSIPSDANLDAWVNRSDVTNEITGTGYTAGGVAQAFTLDALDTTNNRQSVTYTDNLTAWTTATITAVGAIIYKNSGSAATDTLLHFVDFGGTVSVTAGTFGLDYTSPFYINA